MSPVVKAQTSRTPLRRLYQPIAAEMTEVERILRDNLRSNFPFVDELVRYGCHLGGKRLRPALLLLTAKAVGELRPAHLKLAAVVEMIHAATLVHDDVLDEATTRRHLATVNSRWDNEASVLLGDFLFSRALHLASTLDSTYACRAIAAATEVVCEGEMRQKGTRGDFSLSEEDYLGIIEAKTAELYACSCRLGAHFARAGETVEETMAAYGRYLGIAFQIADDVLDLVGDEATTGKSLGTDLDKQKPTLPVIRVLELLDGYEYDKLLQALEGEMELRRVMLQPYVERYDAISYSREKAISYADQAIQQLAGFPRGAAVEALRRLTDFVVTRSV
jgi:octaprenyl-diphosphate synthase